MHSKQHSQDSSHRKQQHRVAILQKLALSTRSIIDKERVKKKKRKKNKLTKLSSTHGPSSAAEEPAGIASAAGGCQLRTDTDYSRDSNVLTGGGYWG